MFFDEAKIYLKAGDGGDGVVAFRREAYVPKGGPSGGNAGKGGDVWLLADPSINTLIAFRKQTHFRAANGVNGRGKNQTGAAGEDLVIQVPVGTAAYDADSGELLADLAQRDARALMARGGRGGRGNRVFRSSTNQAPRIAENGEPGEELWVRLELKLLADAGIVGVPNAGKSTLLSKVTSARPKIADYPFTTLEPNLGVVVVGERDLVLADIPGLIEGAHAGAGLGHQFLRHIERTRVLIHLLDGLSPDPLGDYDAINVELELFNPALRGKPQVVAFNKMDLPDVSGRWPEVARALRARGAGDPQAISAVTGEGLDLLLHRVAGILEELPPAVEDQPVARPVLLPAEDKSFTVERRPDGVWHVHGPYIEKIVAMTKWDYYAAVMRFQRILEALGITQALRVAGIAEGDTVHIGGIEFEWSD
jgi:GTP-binding protein